jgi:Carboxypeptidase regulatory-like domain
MRRILLAVVAVATLTAACTGDDDAGPAPTTDPTVPTTVVDRSGIALAGVRGTTTSTIREVGDATISGSVQGPSGLVPGATVRIERLVAGREVRTDVLTGPDGRFTAADLPGGRYRVRAFLAPSLAQTTPEVRFLADRKEHTFDLTVEQHGGLVVRADVAPEPPLLDGPVNLVALVATRSVGTDGVVRATPVVGATVELVGLGRWQLRSSGGSSSADDPTSTSTSFGVITTSTTSRGRASPTARTDASGRVRFELRCTAAGDPGLALRVPVTVASPPDPTGAPTPPQVTTQTVSLDLPACVDPAASTTTTTGGGSSSSSTTTTSSSTTRP